MKGLYEGVTYQGLLLYHFRQLTKLEGVVLLLSLLDSFFKKEP